MYVESGCQLRVSNVKSTEITLFRSVTVANNAILILASSQKTTFTFEQKVNIVVLSGGTIRDETVHHKIFFDINSSLMIHEGGSFVGSNTVIYSRSTSSVSSNYTIISTLSGPFTCAIVTTGKVEVFSSDHVYCRCNQVNILQETTWINNLVPTIEKPVGLYVAPGWSFVHNWSTRSDEYSIHKYSYR